MDLGIPPVSGGQAGGIFAPFRARKTAAWNFPHGPVWCENCGAAECERDASKVAADVPRALRLLSTTERRQAGGVAAVPSDEATAACIATAASTEAASESEVAEASTEAAKSAGVTAHFPKEMDTASEPRADAVPKYERLWRNRNLGGEWLTAAPEGRGLGRCVCKISCEIDTCLNAVLGIECTDRNCALALGNLEQRSHCHNRRFALAELRAVDECADVFYTGPDKGFGLRAKRGLTEGEFVGEYLGHVVLQSEIQSWRYAMLLKRGVALDASCAGGLTRFMNHSCAPNCCAQRWAVAGKWRIGLFTARPVEKHEELTFSYVLTGRGGLDFGADGSPEVCRCGERACSGFIRASPPSRRCCATRRRRPKEAGRGPPSPCPWSPKRQRRDALATGAAVAALTPPSLNCQEGAGEEEAASLGTGAGESSRTASVGAADVIGELASVGGGRFAHLLAQSWPEVREISVARTIGLFHPGALALSRKGFTCRMLAWPHLTPRLAVLMDRARVACTACAEHGAQDKERQGGACCAAQPRSVHCAAVANGGPAAPPGSGGSLPSELLCSSSIRDCEVATLESRDARVARIVTTSCTCGVFRSI